MTRLHTPQVHNKVLQTTLRTARSKPHSSLSEWSVRHFKNYSELEAYNRASGTRQVIAGVMQSKNVDVESTADFIAVVINSYDATLKLIRHMADALERCLACKGITWEAEHDGDIMIRRAREYLKR